METLDAHGKLIVDLPHLDEDSGKWIGGVQLYFEDGTPLEDVANFVPDKDGGLWVLISPEGSASDWKFFPSYEVPWGEIRSDHNYPEDHE